MLECFKPRRLPGVNILMLNFVSRVSVPTILQKLEGHNKMLL